MDTMKDAFNKICQWCGKPREVLKFGGLICGECDIAVKKDTGELSTIPNRVVK